MTRGKANSGSSPSGSQGGTRGKRTLSEQTKVTRRLNALDRRRDKAFHEAYVQQLHADSIEKKHPVEFKKWASDNPRRADNLKLK